MYYIDLTIQLLAKITMQVVPFIAGLIILIGTITAIKRDTSWLKKVIDKTYIKML